MKKCFAILCLLVLAFNSAGCPAAEIQATRYLAASKGVIEEEMGKHAECRNSSTTPLCSNLNQAIPAQHAAVLILDTYCSSDDYLNKQGVCIPPTDPAAKKALQIKLNAAVNNLKPIIDSIKAATGRKP